MESNLESQNRRPVASRKWPVMQRVVDGLIARGVRANAISVSSAVFGVLAGICLAATASFHDPTNRVFWFLSVILIQARLLANLFDGMVAIGSGQRSTVGELYNEVPDRISDVAILSGAGVAVGGVFWLGLVAAISALLVAYARAIGAATGAGQCFLGPMAKQHRMFLMTLLGLAGTILPNHLMERVPGLGYSLVNAVLSLIVVGCIVTLIRRLLYIARVLRRSETS